MPRDDGSLRAMYPVVIIIGLNIIINIAFIFGMIIAELTDAIVHGKLGGQLKLSIFFASMIVCVSAIAHVIFKMSALRQVRAFVVRDFDNVE